MFTVGEFCFIYPVWLTLTVDFAYLDFFFFFIPSVYSQTALYYFFQFLMTFGTRFI